MYPRYLAKLFSLFFILLFLGLAGHAQSQDKYPTRAINIIVPFTPGGSPDMSARATASFLSRKWGVPDDWTLVIFQETPPPSRGRAG